MKDPSEVSQQDLIVSETVHTFKTFESMGIKHELLKGVHKCAQSGTGKTAAFSIGTLQSIDTNTKKVQVLILSPTRELANQIYQVVSSLSDYLPIRCVAVCGGRNNITLMAHELSKGAQLVVGTPGRVLDLTRQGRLRLDCLRILVLDEADEMLNRGLKTQMENIFNLLPLANELRYPPERRLQVVIVSATLSPDNLEVIQQFVSDPVRILIPRDELTLTGLKQFHIDCGEEKWKYESLRDLFASVCVAQTVIFVNTRRKVEWLSGLLRRDCFTVEAVHGDLAQNSRDGVMNRFRSGSSRILVSSDIWARGIDVQNVGLVINYDLPQSLSDYLHRIGRSGRFGRRGLAISFVAGTEDKKQLNLISSHYDIHIEPAPASLANMLIDDDSLPYSGSLSPGKKQNRATHFVEMKNRSTNKSKKRKKKRLKRIGQQSKKV